MKTSIKLIVLFFFPISLFAQDMSRVKRDIDTLTSPAMHGRGYVNHGDRIAANYISDQFKQVGLQSFSGSYFQPFTLDINTFPKKVRLKVDGKTLVPGKDYIVDAISAGGKGRGKMVYLDTLIFTEEAARQRFLQSNFKNKVMVYRSTDYGKLVDLPLNYLNKMHEAKALIALQPGKLTASLSNKQLSHPTFEIVEKEFNTQAKKAQFQIDAQLIKDYPSQNVIGYVRGKVEPDSFIVVSAHYDHLGRMGKDTYFPGANDNASGTSMLMELARYYAQPANQPDYSIAFMAFGAEEAGLIGSKYYTQHPLFPLSQIKFMINLDLVGTGEEGMTVVNSTALPYEFNLLTRINQQKGYLPVINKRSNAPNSDHFFFTNKGVKAVFFYTLGGIKAYHDVFDRAETLPLTKYKEVYRLIQDFIGEL